MEMICERARSPDNNLPQLFLCPEGTNTNRKVLIQFKVGAFAPGVPVQPVLIRYPGTERVDPITWTYNQSHSYKFSVWYLLANPINRVEVEFLPVYTPNVEEVSKAEVYAKNVQKLMAEALEIQATEISCGAFYKEYCKQQNTYIQEDSEKTNDIKKTNWLMIWWKNRWSNFVISSSDLKKALLKKAANYRIVIVEFKQNFQTKFSHISTFNSRNNQEKKKPAGYFVT